MRILAAVIPLVLILNVHAADPMRVALLDFDNSSAPVLDQATAAGATGEGLAQKGAYLLGKRLVNGVGYTLIDRRDFMNQIEKLQPTDQGGPTPTKPSFIHAAQLLGADVVLRGSLQSISTSKRLIDLGGHKTDFSDISVRVAIQALDSVDGSVIAMSDGTARRELRQTDAEKRVLGEDGYLDLMDTAVGIAVLDIQQALTKRLVAQGQRTKVKLSVSSDADPAMVEVDGVLIGNTPLVDFEIYAGDHVLTVGKGGHRDVTKRILLDRDVKITVPLFKSELSAQEQKEILEKARVNAYIGIEPQLIIEHVRENP